MPTYLYRCSNDECRAECKIRHAMTSTKKHYCDVCYGELRKVIETTPIHYRSGGFTRQGKE